MAAAHGNIHVMTSKQEWDGKLFEATTNGKIEVSAEWDVRAMPTFIFIKDGKLFEATTNGKIIVVDFTAAWCGPCKMIAPLYAELSEKYPQLVFLKVDVDEMAEVSAEWDVRAMPTFIFIKDGKQIDKLVGLNQPELEKKVLNCVAMTQSA